MSLENIIALGLMMGYNSNAAAQTHTEKMFITEAQLQLHSTSQLNCNGNEALISGKTTPTDKRLSATETTVFTTV